MSNLVSIKRKRSRFDFFFLYSMIHFDKVSVGDNMANLFTPDSNPFKESNQSLEQPEKDTKEEPKEEVAKVFGISLTDIEEIHLPNGKEYFKFYNPEDRTVKMIENRRDGKNLSEQFKEIQQTLSYSQGENSLSNARAVFDYQLRYQNIELNLIPIASLKNNRASYRYLFDNIDIETKKAVRVLLENADFLELEYINFENAIGIDKNNRVINASYNAMTGKCELKAAEVRNYETNKTDSTGDGYVFDISDEEFDSLIDGIDVSSDIPTIIPEEDVNGIEGASMEAKSNSNPTIRGRQINMLFAIQAYQYPEIIDRGEMSEFDKMIYRGIARAIARKKAKRNSMTHQKQYVLTQNQNKSQAAFVNTVLLALIAGFLGGVLLMFAITFIRNLF